jgi:multidrug resistance protein, MATE family
MTLSVSVSVYSGLGRRRHSNRQSNAGRKDLFRLLTTLSASLMASMHYGTPSSLPSDYALLSRYVNARGTINNDDPVPVDDLYDSTEPSDVLDDMIPIRPARRCSFPSPYLRPLQPKLPEPFASVPDEYSPLLVPRIVEVEEDASPSTDPTRPQSTAKVYWDEFCILCKYSLPVFRWASSFACCL